VNGYFNETQNQELRIRYVADTHQHNDYVSGICELAPRPRVEILSGARAELGYATRRLNDGERFQMGQVVFEVLHTPGHTPEHIGFLLVDRSLQEKILKLPDPVEVYPTHVSGSLCGGSIGSRLSTTLRAQDEQTVGGAQLRNEFRRELLKAGKSTGCAALLEADAQDEPARTGAPRHSGRGSRIAR
jgi:hydroxyacylglutathione hydrolase